MQFLLLFRPVAQSSSTVVRCPDRAKGILPESTTSPSFVIFVSLHSQTPGAHTLNQTSTVDSRQSYLLLARAPQLARRHIGHMAPPLPSPSTPNPSALRELALRSMKPKRKPMDQPDARKPPSLQTNISLPPRLIPSPKDVLDYGEPIDMDSKSPTSPASAVSSTRPGLSRLGSIRLRATGQASTVLVQESKDREEGEISEEEIRGKKQEEKPKLPKKRAGKKQQNDFHAGHKHEAFHTSTSASTSTNAPPLAQPQPSRPLATPDAIMVEVSTSGLVAGTNRPKVPPLQPVSRAMTPLQPLSRQDELSPATQRLNQEVLEKLAHYQVEIDEAHCRPGLPSMLCS
jgi:hypothetical protein